MRKRWHDGWCRYCGISLGVAEPYVAEVTVRFRIGLVSYDTDRESIHSTDVCRLCGEGLEVQNEELDTQCPDCERVIQFYQTRRCYACIAMVCEYCIHAEHIDRCDAEWDDYD